VSGEDSRTDDSGNDDELRNVVLVTIDSLRADHCGYWGYERDTTPTLDRMAEEGFVFEQAIAPGPNTYESMPAVFTGRHTTTFREDVRRAVADDVDEDALDALIRGIEMNMSGRTIPEWFAEQGYTTGAFTPNPYTGADTEFARGFDYYEDFLKGGEGPLMRKAAHLPVLSELKHVVTLVRGDRVSKRWTDFYDRIVEWARNAEEPYFLWVFLLDTHTPYLSDEQYRSAVDRSRPEMYYHNWRLWMERKWRSDGDHSGLNQEALVDLYDATVRSVDDFIGRLLGDLDQTDPAVVVHSDHGEAFGEHGEFSHDVQLYEENIHVPLIVGNPGPEFGTGETAPVSLADLPELLRTVAKSEGDLSGVADGPVISKTFDGTRFVLRGPDWKYMCRTDPKQGMIHDERIYDLQDDPEEREPLESSDDVGGGCRSMIRRRLQHESELNALVAAVPSVGEGGE